MKYDPVNHPKHYAEQAAQLEPIAILRYAPFDLGNAFKYIIRAGHKDDYLQDLQKARWYLDCAEKTFSSSDESIRWCYTNFFKTYGMLLMSFKNVPEVSLELDTIEIIQEYLSIMDRRINETKNSH